MISTALLGSTLELVLDQALEALPDQGLALVLFLLLQLEDCPLLFTADNLVLFSARYGSALPNAGRLSRVPGTHLIRTAFILRCRLPLMT